MVYLSRHIGDMHHAFECTFISLMYYADMDIFEREREREYTDTCTNVPLYYSPEYKKFSVLLFM